MHVKIKAKEEDISYLLKSIVSFSFIRLPEDGKQIENEADM